MARIGPSDLGLLINGYDLAQDAIDATIQSGALLEEGHGWGDSWVEQLFTGVKQGEFSFNGRFDDAAGRTVEALVGNAGAASVACILFGSAQGSDFVGYEGLKASHARSASRDGVHKIALNVQGARIEDGEIIESLGVESGDGATGDGSLDNSASSANGGAGYLQVKSLTLGGYTSVTVKIQESSDDGAGDAYADVVTFTAVTAAEVAERIAVAAGTTVERYLRVTLTWNGSGSGESITLLVGFARS